MRSLARLAVLLATMAAVCPRLAVADETLEQSRSHAIELYRKGKTAFESRRFREALAAFADSYALAPAPQMLFNMAHCHEELDELEEALAGYRRFRTVAAAEDQLDVEQRIALVEQRMATTGERRRVTLPTSASTGPPARRSLVKAWWPWTILGVGVVGVAVGLGVGLTVGRPDTGPFSPIDLRANP